MRNERRARVTYTDVLDRNTPSEFEPLLSDLEALYTRAEPPADLHVSIKWALRERAADRRRASMRVRRLDPSRWRSRRFSTAIVFAIVLLALATLAFTFAALVLNRDPGMRHVAEQNLNTQFNLTQTRNGFTVTLHSAYADSNRVLIEYSVAGPPDRTFNSTVFLYNSLVVETGLSLPLTGGRGERYPDGIRQILTFDTSGVAGNPDELSLHLQFDDLDVNEWIPDEEMTTAKPGVENVPDGYIRSFTVNGPLDFEFTIPFYPSRVAKLDQARTIGGKKVMLEQVVVTQSQARAFIRGITSEYTATLEVGGTQYLADPLAQVTDLTTGELLVEDMTVFDFSEPLYDKDGVWTLTILPPKGQSTEAGGPWVFEFIVPD